MAAECPRCGTTLKDDYGMTQCPSCSVFIFVDMDGNANINSPDSQTNAEQIVPTRIIEIDLDDVRIITEETPDISSTQAPIESVFENPEIIFESNEPEPSNYEPLDFQMGISEEAPADLLPPENQPIEITSDPLPDLGPNDDPLGLSDFANSEISSGKDGPFLFRILITGIDSKEIRESIREALEDSRFAWNPDQLLAKLEKGKLVIEDLAPVKATIIVHRLRRLPVKVRWEQYAISQIEPS